MDKKTEKRRAAMAALDYDRVLEGVAALCLTDYGRDRVLALTPPFVPDAAWTERIDREETLEGEFDRIDALTAAVQRGEELPFAGVRDLGDALKRAAVPGSRLEAGELLDVAQLLSASNRLRHHLTKRDESLAPLQAFVEVLPYAPELISRIEKTISPRTAQVVDDASPELARLRRAIEGSQKSMRTRLDRLVRQYTESNLLLESGFTVRDDRYVLAVRATAKGRVHGIVHGYSASGNTIFVEPDELVAIGNDMRRLIEEEGDEVRRILAELTDAVRERIDELRDAVLAVGLLDSLQARARFADQMGAMRPAVREGVLRLVEARHPLLVLRKGIDGTVPLSVHLGGDLDESGAESEEQHGRAFVVTGPNAGGKTVTLKTVGLATALIHAGIWPPCGDGTIVPPIDEWHVVIGDDQSLEGDLSSFTGHLEKIKTITVSPAPNKLVLVDEIASGTDPAEGGPLAMSFLETAVERGWWTLVTTHMGELKAFAHKTDGVRNGSMQFDRASLSPTYVFQPDLPGSSYALEIASRVGMPKRLVKRARDIAGGGRQRLEDLIGELGNRLKGAKDRERELEQALQRAEVTEARLQERLEKIEAKRDEAVSKATAEAKRILDEANRTIEHTVKQIKEQQASREAILAAKQRVADQAKEVEEKGKRASARQATRKKRGPRQGSPKRLAPEKRTTPTEPAPDPLTGPIEVGDSVLFGDSNTRADVLALKKDKAQVAAGSLKMWVPLDDLRKVRRSAPSGHATVSMREDDTDDPGPRAFTGGGRVGGELMLIGKRVEEAERELKGYLEAATREGLPWARIVHGKGTGALRAMVQSELAGQETVDDYRFGEPGEGGDGVTIVHFVK